MAVRFSDEQVLKATPGRWVQQSARASYSAVCTDSRALSPGCLFVALAGERFDAHAFLKDAVAQGAAAAVVQKGKPLPPLPRAFGLFEVEDTLSALGGLARFHRLRFKMPLGAVTGSNGKTTTKEMVAAILETRGTALKTEGNLNNEVGVPLTLFRLEPTHAAAIIEMGMSNPGEIGRLTEIAQPDAGLITVVQAAHLQGLGSIEGIAAAKGELFSHLKLGATAVVNIDEPLIAAQAAAAPAKKLTFGRSASADVRLLRVSTRGREGLEIALHADGREHAIALAFLGEHNAMNATGAFALARALGYSADQCVRGLTAAKPYQRRLNWIDTPQGFAVIDDCYNANPASMDAALKTLASLATSGRAIAVLGDMLELGDDEAKEHRALGEKAAQQASTIAFFGPRSKAGHEAAVALKSNAAHFAEIGPLVEWLKPQLNAGDVVLVKASRGMKLERVVEALTGRTAGAH